MTDDPDILHRIEQQKDTAYREGEMTPENRILEQVRKAHAPALRQLRERVEITHGHAKDARRWLVADVDADSEPVQHLEAAMDSLFRARLLLKRAERALADLGYTEPQL